MGFMGMGMANAVGGMNPQGLYGMGAGNVPPQNQYATAPGGGFAQPQAQAPGAAMVAAAREGLIERLPGVFLASDLVRCHRRPKQVWRSLVWRAR